MRPMIEPTSNDQTQVQAYDNWKWADRNADLQKQYEGEMTAVHQKQVIAHGRKRRRVLEQIAQ